MSKAHRGVILAFILIFTIGIELSSGLVGTVSAASSATVAGWDFEDHTYHHLDLRTLTPDQITAELQLNAAAFAQHGLASPQHLAYPMGTFDDGVIGVVSQYRLTGRTAGWGGTVFPETYPVSEWYTMTSACLQSDITISQVKDWINLAETKKALLNLFTHKVSNPPITYGCTPTFLGQVLDYLVQEQKAGRLQVMSMRQAYSSFNGQKAVVVISFDDGWVTDYTTVWPMFKTRNLVGTSYIAGSSVDSGNPDVMTWAMITEMAQSLVQSPSVKSFTVSPEFFSPSGPTKSTSIKASFSMSVSWTIQILNSVGTVVKSFSGSGTSLSVSWNGKNNANSLVPDGDYKVNLDGVSASGSSFATVSKQVTVDTVRPAVSGLSVSPSSFKALTEQTVVSYSVSENCYATIKVFDSKNKVAATLLNDAPQTSGLQSVSWNGVGTTGKVVTAGVYTIKIYITDYAANDASPYPITATVRVT